ncbi:hypothetical protein ACFLUG_00615 [Chloroflexota bacterium]
MNRTMIFSPLLILVLLMTALLTACDQPAGLEISLSELKENQSGGYYDAVVTVDRIDDFAGDADKDDFYLRASPSGSYFSLADLSFISDGENEGGLEKGDTFVVPLQDPDWRFSITGPDDTVVSINILEKLPESRRYHPLKSEAAGLARSIIWQQENGKLQPSVPVLLPEWELADKKLEPSPGDFAHVEYRKSRVSETRELLSVLFRELSPAEMEEFAGMSGTEFIRRLYAGSWLVDTYGREEVVDGRNCLVVDAVGVGEYSWFYSYNHIEDGYLKRIEIDADAREWVMTAAEKEQEKVSRAIFITYEYGLEPGAEWAVSITLRRNGEGVLGKTSSSGVEIEKGFVLSSDEMKIIDSLIMEIDLSQDNPMEVEPDDPQAVMTVYGNDMEYTLRFDPEQPADYDELENLLRQTVLHKTGELP